MACPPLDWFAVATAMAVIIVPSMQAAVPEALESELGRELPSLVQFYQALHREPELSFQEIKTSARLATELRAALIEDR